MLVINQRFFLFAFSAVLLLFIADPAFASGTSAMPWDGPLDKLRASMTGPVAFAISLIGIVVAGGMLIFGGELGEFARRAIMLVLVLALLVLANNVLTAFYSSASATIAGNTPPQQATRLV